MTLQFITIRKYELPFDLEESLKDLLTLRYFFEDYRCDFLEEECNNTASGAVSVDSDRSCRFVFEK